MEPLALSHTLHLVRHGETDWNREARIQGSRDIPLNALGRRQAREAAQRLRDLVNGYDRLDFVSSPMDRSRRTMELLRDELGLPPAAYRIEPDLRELTFGRWEGLTWREIRKTDPGRAAARAADKWGYVPPGGESYAMLAERVAPVFAGFARDTVVVSHGGVMRAAMALTGFVPIGEAANEDIWQGRVLMMDRAGLRWV